MKSKFAARVLAGALASLTLAPLALLPRTARADPPVMMAHRNLSRFLHLLAPVLFPRCSEFGGTKYACVYDPMRVAEAITPMFPWEERIEADYRVTYSFPCSMQSVGLHFVAGGTTYPIEMGADHLTRVVTASEALELKDLAPDQTAVHWLMGPCSVTLHSVTATPSFGTLNGWQRDAQAKAQEINLLIEYQRSLAGLLSIIDFDASELGDLQRRLLSDIGRQLPEGLTLADVTYGEDHPDASLRGQLKDPGDMPPAWSIAFGANPLLRANVMTFAQVESVLAGRPAYTAADLDALRARLFAAGQRASEMVQRGERFREHFDATMQGIHDALAGAARQAQGL